VLQRVTGWLRAAERVVLLVGAGTGDDSLDSANIAAWRPEDRDRYGHVAAFRQDPSSFLSFWLDWRLKHRKRQPTATHLGVVALSHVLNQATIVTERTDSLLAVAGVRG
jgi:NAD-dependent SIR2 family protein deacetylase